MTIYFFVGIEVNIFFSEYDQSKKWSITVLGTSGLTPYMEVVILLVLVLGTINT